MKRQAKQFRARSERISTKANTKTGRRARRRLEEREGERVGSGWRWVNPQDVERIIKEENA